MRDVSPLLSSYEDVVEKISSEENKSSFLSAFLLAHGFLESYLIEILIYSGADKNTLTSSILKNLERAGFSNILTVNFVIGNISEKLFKRISSFNSKRNVLVHELTSLDFNNKKFIEKLKRDIASSKIALKELSKVYMDKINFASKQYL